MVDEGTKVLEILAGDLAGSRIIEVDVGECAGWVAASSALLDDIVETGGLLTVGRRGEWEGGNGDFGVGIVTVVE